MNLRNHSLLALWLSVCALLVSVTAVAAQDFGVQATYHDDGSATYHVIDSDVTFAGQSHLLPSFGGPRTNDSVGANRFYAEGYQGTSAAASNIEAGHVWNQHETLMHVSIFDHGNGALGSDQSHATAAGHTLAGRFTASPHNRQDGIARQAELRSGAIATNFLSSPAGAFDATFGSVFYAYESATVGFGAVDVINSSWGGTGTDTAPGMDVIAVGLDGMAFQNNNTTFVVSAGNSGPTDNTVGSPGSGYNNITVGALSSNLTSVASFSSRGPQDYGDPVNGTISEVRAAVDIVAPGTNLNLATISTATPGTVYTNQSGTSFAAPIVAGGVALMHDAAQGEGLPATSTDVRTIKANLLNAATKTTGWDNGQTLSSGVITTTQSLDWAAGAGAINLDQTFDQFVTGQTDIAGISGGTTSQTTGWDFAQATVGSNVDIFISTQLDGGTDFSTTLTWLRDRGFTNNNDSTYSIFDNRQTDLDLEVWQATSGGTFTTKVAESISDYNVVEHLVFTLPTDGYYGIRVVHDETTFGTPADEEFAIAWNGTALVGAALNDTVIDVTAGDPANFGRVMLGQMPSLNVTLGKTGVEGTSYTVTPNNSGLTHNASGVFAGGNQSETFQLSLVNNANGTGSTGFKSFTATVDNTAADSAAAGQGSADPNDVVNASATVVDNRVVTGSAVNFGSVITGGTVSATSTLTTSGGINDFTTVTVQGTAIAADANGIGATGSGPTVFNNGADSTTRTIGGTVSATGGAFSGNINYVATGEGLTGEVVQPVVTAYTGTAIDHANASFNGASDQDTLSINFGSVALNSSVADQSFNIFNLVDTPSFTARLDLDSVTPSGDFSVLSTNLASFNNLTAGNSNGFLASFDTSTAGTFNASYALQLSDENLPGATNQSLTLNISGTVNANPLNDSVIDVNAGSSTIDFGRVMLGQTPSENVQLDKTGNEATTYTVSPSNNGLSENSSGAFAAGTQSETFALSLVNNANGSATTGVKSFSAVVENTAPDSAAAGQGSDDPNNSISAAATVVDNRIIDGSTVNFGTVITGASVSGVTTLSTTGDDDNNTRVTVDGTGVAADSNGILASASTSQLFDEATDTTTRNIGGTVVATGGNVTGTVAFSTTGEGLTGELVQPVEADYNLTVLDHSNASFSSGFDQDVLNINFGTLVQNTTASQSYDIFNEEDTTGFTAGLDFDSFTQSGDFSVLAANLTTFSNLGAGGSNGYLATFDTSNLGSFSATYNLVLSDQNLPGATGGQSLTLNLFGTVVAVGTAVPEPASLTLWALLGLVGAIACVRRRRGR